MGNDKKDLIVFVATAWGPTYGGINAFNADIAKALAEILPSKYHIVCITLNADYNEIADAKNSKVTLLSIRNPEKKEKYELHQVEQIVKAVKKLTERLFGGLDTMPQQDILL